MQGYSLYSQWAIMILRRKDSCCVIFLWWLKWIISSTNRPVCHFSGYESDPPIILRSFLTNQQNAFKVLLTSNSFFRRMRWFISWMWITNDCTAFLMSWSLCFCTWNEPFALLPNDFPSSKNTKTFLTRLRKLDQLFIMFCFWRNRLLLC